MKSIFGIAYHQPALNLCVFCSFPMLEEGTVISIVGWLLCADHPGKILLHSKNTVQFYDSYDSGNVCEPCKKVVADSWRCIVICSRNRLPPRMTSYGLVRLILTGIVYHQPALNPCVYCSFLMLEEGAVISIVCWLLCADHPGKILLYSNWTYKVMKR